MRHAVEVRSGVMLEDPALNPVIRFDGSTDCRCGRRGNARAVDEHGEGRVGDVGRAVGDAVDFGWGLGGGGHFSLGGVVGW